MQTVKSLDSIPAYMRSLNQWVLWRYEDRKNKKTKIPYQSNGRKARTNDPITWGIFDEISAVTGYDGLGFVFAEGDQLTGIDADHCIYEDGTLADWTIDLVQLFKGTYMERSPSGDGLHIICRGRALQTGARKWLDERKIEVGIEVYNYKSPRYFAVTGDVFNEYDIADCQPQLEQLYQMHFCDEEVFSKSSESKGYSVEDALSHISSDDYEVWLKIGMALKSSGYEVDVWDEWSRTSSKYNPGDCEKKWVTFRKDGVGLGSLFFIAKQHGWTPPPLNSPVVTPLAHRESETTADEQKPGSIFTFTGPSGNPVEHSRWKGGFVPYSYRLTDAGLLKTSEEKPQGEIISGPVCALARTASPDGGNSGLVLEVENIDGEYITIPIPRTRLHEDACVLSRDLADQGFYILSGREKELLRYLCMLRPDDKRFAVSQTGWAHTNEPDKLVYVLPNTATEAGYHFQPERYNPSTNSVKSKGTLNDWIENVYDSDPYPLFAVLSALTGPLLKPAQIDSGGFHFFGGSSSGKTTLGQIAATVWGNGSDPSDAPTNPYVKRWNATLNAMEGLCASHNDMALILDELGSCNAKDFGRAIYDIAGGQGKSAMDASRNMRKQRSWRVSIISTGEVSSRTKIEEALTGKNTQAKAGQMIRLIDIEVKPDMFSSRQQVDKIKRSCGQYFGVLGPEFIQRIVDKFSETEFRELIQDNLDKILERLIQARGNNVTSVQQRALRRFALVETAGHLLVHFGLVPALNNAIVRRAIDTVVNDWIPTSFNLNDVERSLVLLREFILKNRDSRFKELQEYTRDDKMHREIAGYYDSTKNAFFILPGAFAEATGGEPRVTATVLRDRDFLTSDRAGRLTHRVMVDGNNIKAYCIKAEFLGSDTND